MSRASLARAAGVPASAIAAFEGGRERPSEAVFLSILRAARLRPSIPLAFYADDVLAEARRFRLRDVRVFGSVVRGHDTETSDIDLLVSITSTTSLFDLGGFAHAVEQITGFPVDLLADDLYDDEQFRHVLVESVPL
ncbi:nucleotidyltransferase domain-containing protein [Curtobacterium sp. AB451]|uniref:nucleotidyltransferase domain-containing protein n=1 Tax=Curtobacterium sp. AB451 TaxID=3422306 RepID=UPI003D33DF74